MIVNNENKIIKTTIYLPSDLERRISALAKKLRRSVSMQIVCLLDDALFNMAEDDKKNK